MTTEVSHSNRADLALAVYLEDLVSERDVLYVGDARSGAAERLARAARNVEVCAPRSRSRGGRRGRRMAPRRWPTEEDFGRWDVVVVADMAKAGFSNTARLVELENWLADGGVLVAGTSVDGGLSYDAFYELLDGHFAQISMLGQAPFDGVSVVDFTPGRELEVTFDGSLLKDGVAPSRYIAVCADAEFALDSFLVVQTPSIVDAQVQPESTSEPGDKPRLAALEAQVAQQQAMLDAANEHAEQLERALAQAGGSKGQGAQAQRAGLEAEVEKLRTENANLRREFESAGDEEFVRIESVLRERGRRVAELEQEVTRREILARDLIEELREACVPSDVSEGVTLLPTSAPVGESTSLERALNDAVDRAVSMEAGRAALGFELDEARGELALSQKQSTWEIESLERLEAALRGTVRGLNARLSELTELYQQSQARLALAAEDRLDAERRSAEMGREVAELREALELELCKPRATPDEEQHRDAQPADKAADAESSEKWMQSLVKAREEAVSLGVELRDSQSEADDVRKRLEHIEEELEGVRFGFERRVAELVNESNALASTSTTLNRECEALGDELSTAQETNRRLEGELVGVRMRLADREAAVQALAAEAQRSADAPDATVALKEHLAEAKTRIASLEDELASAPEVDVLEEAQRQLERLHRELAALRSESAHEDDSMREREAAAEAREGALRTQLAAQERLVSDLRDGLDAREGWVERGRVDELEAMVGSRDAMIARIQRTLVEVTRRRDLLSEEAARAQVALEACEQTSESLREAGDSTQAVDRRELEELMSRLEKSEAERRAASQALMDAREILASDANSGAETAPTED